MYLIKGVSKYGKAEKLTQDVTEEQDFMQKLETAGFTLTIQKLDVKTSEEYAMFLIFQAMEEINGNNIQWN